MGIKIFVRWEDQWEDEEQLEEETWLAFTEGDIGCLQEAYHGEPYATHYLVPEAFKGGGNAFIPAAVLRDRLPETLRLAEMRQRHIYDASPDEIHSVILRYILFVELCEHMEEKAGKPAQILAWW